MPKKAKPASNAAYNADLASSVHSAAAGLHRARIIDDEATHQFGNPSVNCVP
jgi:hypothetical protein